MAIPPEGKWQQTGAREIFEDDELKKRNAAGILLREIFGVAEKPRKWLVLRTS